MSVSSANRINRPRAITKKMEAACRRPRKRALAVGSKHEGPDGSSAVPARVQPWSSRRSISRRWPRRHQCVCQARSVEAKRCQASALQMCAARPLLECGDLAPLCSWVVGKSKRKGKSFASRLALQAPVQCDAVRGAHRHPTRLAQPVRNPEPALLGPGSWALSPQPCSQGPQPCSITRKPPNSPGDTTASSTRQLSRPSITWPAPTSAVAASRWTRRGRCARSAAAGSAAARRTSTPRP